MKVTGLRKSLAALAIIASASTVSSIAYAVDGSYVSNATGANILTANTWYRTNFPLSGGVPPTTAKVTSINWQYNIGMIPSGGTFVAQLCHGTTLNCIDISTAKNGSTTAFANRNASIAFFMQYRVNRTSAFPALYGHPAQLIVNWTN